MVVVISSLAAKKKKKKRGKNLYEKEELEGGWTAFLTARTDVGIVTWRRFMRSLSLCKRTGLHHKIYNNTLAQCTYRVH